jgi:hypothetical protein
MGTLLGCAAWRWFQLDPNSVKKRYMTFKIPPSSMPDGSASFRESNFTAAWGFPKNDQLFEFEEKWSR